MIACRRYKLNTNCQVGIYRLNQNLLTRICKVRNGDQAPQSILDANGFNRAVFSVVTTRQVIDINQVSIVIVDNIPIVRYGLRDLLEKQSGMKVQAEACTADEAVGLIRSIRPDIIILEKSIFCGDSIATLERMVREYGGKLLAYTNDISCGSVQSFLDQGGKGFVLKADPLVELTNAIEALISGKTYISSRLRRSKSSIACAHPQQVELLSRREVEIAELVAQGYTSAEIADCLCISRRTVETHRHKIMKKLSISSRAELVALMKSNLMLL